MSGTQKGPRIDVIPHRITPYPLPRLRCLTVVVDEQTMAQDVHHVCRCASSVSRACFDAGQRPEGEADKTEEEVGSSCLQQADVGGRVSLDLSVQRTPLLQPAAWLLVSWPLGLVFTIDLRPCEAASHHVGSLTQTHTSRLPSLGRAGRPMLGLTLSSITRRGSMCPLHLPQPAISCPRPDLRSMCRRTWPVMPLAVVPFLTTPRLVPPTSSLRSHAEPQTHC